MLRYSRTIYNMAVRQKMYLLTLYAQTAVNAESPFAWFQVRSASAECSTPFHQWHGYPSVWRCSLTHQDRPITYPTGASQPTVTDDFATPRSTDARAQCPVSRQLRTVMMMRTTTRREVVTATLSFRWCASGAILTSIWRHINVRTGVLRSRV